MAQPTPQQIAQQFVEFFYQTFDSNRNGLAALFKEESSLTLGDQDCVQGSALIMEKLTSLGAQTVHRITSFDVQPSVSPNAILVVVTGEISIDGAGAMKFSETFQLVAAVAGQFYVHNDIFKLNYG